MLIDTALLIVLGIVSESGKHLGAELTEIKWKLSAPSLTGTFSPRRTSSMGISDMNKSDQRRMWELPPRTAVVVENNNMAASCSLTYTYWVPENFRRHHRAQRMSSASVYVSEKVAISSSNTL
jgi:hypothetical protein